MEPPPSVAIVQPASPPDQESFERGLEVLKKLGISFKSFVEFNESSPPQKAFLLCEIITSGKYSYVWAVRGGAGCIKLLPFLDELFNTPSRSRLQLPTFIGFSDITTLFIYLWKKFRKKSIHAPMIVNLPETDKEVKDLLRAILIGEIREIHHIGETYRAGLCRGLLLGGNLTTFASLCGTPYFPLEEAPIILFFEDRGEKQYKLERSLLQVLYSFPKNSVKGLLFGDLGGVDPKNLIRSIEDFLSQELVVAFNFSFGHIPKNYPLIFGAEVELKAKVESAELIVKI